jgi:hypothetical protein
MSVKFITNELALADPDFRNDLIENFETTEKSINKIIDLLSSDDTSNFVDKKELEDKLKDLKKEIKDNDKNLKERINRILLGTDVESIELVVTRVLKEKGVIN